MRASIRGGGGDSGKCTIEVEVDGVADVEVRGDTAFIRTLEGQRATGRRFECNAVMPRNPVDFRFRGIDGRGDVRLIRDPNQGGVAVVRIQDPKGGREGYTFDLEWRGGGAYSNNGPYSNGNDPYNRGRQNPNYDPYYNGRRNDPNYNPNYNPNYRGRADYGSGNVSNMVGVCQDEVRIRARNQYGVRDPRFLNTGVGDNPGPHDRVGGTFEGNRGERYEFSCTINTNNGRVGNVDIRRR